MSWSWDSTGDDVDDVDDYITTAHWSNKDSLIFLIDCSREMFEGEEKAFELCLKCTTSTMKNKIISSEKDLFGIVFFGTEMSQNTSDFKHVYVYQDLDMLDAQRILDVEQLLGECDNFSSKFGHNSNYSLNDVLWTCSNIFATSSQKIGHKRILLFTNNDEPHRHNPSLQRQAKTKAKDLFDIGIDIELMAIKPSNREFDLSLFYEYIVAEIDEDEKAVLPTAAEKFDELLTRVQHKDNKKRAMCNMSFKFGEGLEMAVSVFNLCRSAVKSSHINLDGKTNEEVKTVTKMICETTGLELMPTDLKYYQSFGGKKISFEKEEVNAIKSFDSQGLKLMGFKPRGFLKRYYHIRPAQFIFPNEKAISGSMQIFTALLKKLVAKDLIAICRYTPREKASPRFVALLPQEEELDEQNVQLSPAGFHLVFLPFADDLRKLNYLETPKANYDQVEKAKQIIKALSSNFDPMNIENPSLQKHYRCLEALALDKETLEDFKDLSEPDLTKMDARLGKLASEFTDLVFPVGYDPIGGAKRKASTTSSSAPKRTKNSENVDIKEFALNGKLSKLTVGVLKEFAKKENIKSGGKKSELIESINIHFGIL